MTNKNGFFYFIKLDIFNTIPDTGEDYPTAMTKLNEYFASKKIWIMKAVQQKDETVDHFATRLKQLAAYCEFSERAR